MFPNCCPFNVEDYFFRHWKAKSSEREQVHFLRSDLFMLAFWGSDICALVWQRSDSAALKSLQPWELERMMSEAFDDKVRADRAKWIKAEVHWETYNWRNDLVAGLGVLTSWGGVVMVLMPALHSVQALYWQACIIQFKFSTATSISLHRLWVCTLEHIFSSLTDFVFLNWKLWQYNKWRPRTLQQLFFPKQITPFYFITFKQWWIKGDTWTFMEDPGWRWRFSGNTPQRGFCPWNMKEATCDSSGRPLNEIVRNAK